MKKYLNTGTKILDVGCGNGKLLIPLTRAGFCVTGIDLSMTALLTITSAPCGLVQGDTRHLPFKDETFGAVVCYDVLQHLLEGERQNAIREMGRVLVPGGMIFIETFGKKDMRYGGTLVEPDTFRRQSGIVYHYFTEDEIVSILSGFTILMVDSVTTEKTFHGEKYIRHRITSVAKK